ncbi:MAG TPA: 3-oxo-tetronate 4-phosphate decarboxylase [Burkholderiaceae bacterium]|nr:3-oxo-tetronate 4-phosphate decarboxylase [Burkholderiaceae bacterium]
MTEDALRDRIVALARSLFERGLTHGSTGNLSARLPDGRWLVTPTGSSFGTLEAGRLALLDADGTPLAGDPPSKESALHLAVYRERPRAGAVVHLHSTHSVAVSVLADVDPADVLPPLTAYYVMRVGTLPLLPYHPPGDPALAEAVRRCAGRHHALLLANHGPVVAGRTLEAAADAVEELEATARLFLALNGRACRCLDAEQVAALRTRFPVDA